MGIRINPDRIALRIFRIHYLDCRYLLFSLTKPSFDKERGFLVARMVATSGGNKNCIAVIREDSLCTETDIDLLHRSPHYTENKEVK